MSKTKIVEEHENALAALQGLSLPPESNPLVKRIDRAFKELRGLHSETERDRQELSRRVAHLEEYLNNAIRDVRAARVRIDSLENQAICLASNIAARMSGQESKSKLDAEIAAFQQKLERLGVEYLASHPDLASQLLPLFIDLVETVNSHVETMLGLYEQDIATYRLILCLACIQKGPFQLSETSPDALGNVDLEICRQPGGWSLRANGT